MRQFRGSYEQTLGSQYELVIPQAFRARLFGPVVVAPSFEIEDGAPRAVGIWEASEYEAYTGAVTAGLNPVSPVARQLKQVLYGHAYDATADEEGRITIPQQLVDYARLAQKVMVVGTGTAVEVFDQLKYQEYLPTLLEHVAQIAAKLDSATTA